MSVTVSNLSNGSVTTDNINCVYKNMATAGANVVSTSPVTLYGVVINSHTSGVIKIWDNTTATGSIVCNSITFAAGSGYYNLFGITTGTACTVSIGGTADITLAYRRA